MKKTAALMLLVIISILQAVCGAETAEHEHEWRRENCTETARCAICGVASDEPAEHQWVTEACSDVAICSICGIKTETTAGHIWQEATYAAPRTCTICGKTQGNSISVEIGEIVVFGAYEQDTHLNNGPEAINWLVLDVNNENNSILIISYKGLDCKKFNEEQKSVTWETCTLRTWLNSTFINEAFTAEQQKWILTTAVDNSRSQHPTESRGSCATTYDKIFLLSYAEADRYFKNNTARACAPTAYAANRGAWQNNYGVYKDAIATGFWWLRSPGSTAERASGVRYNGFLDRDDTVSRWDDMVRPALWVNKGCLDG